MLSFSDELHNLRQQLDSQREDHNIQLARLQAQIEGLRRQNNRLRRLSTNDLSQIRREASENLNITEDEVDNELNMYTFGSFDDFWARVKASEYSSSEASINTNIDDEIDKNSSGSYFQNILRSLT